MNEVIFVHLSTFSVELERKWRGWEEKMYFFLENPGFIINIIHSFGVLGFGVQVEFKFMVCASGVSSMSCDCVSCVYFGFNVLFY
jgi:hypothetical protein